MRSMKKCGVLVTVVCALSAFGAADASARFTYSAPGTIHGVQLEKQVFKPGSGEVSCSNATTTGALLSRPTLDMHLTVHYSNCTAFGVVGAHISTATYLLTTDGTVHIVAPITITVTKTLFTAHCTVTVGAQTLSKVDVATNGNNLKLTPTVTGIHSVGSGGVCGGTNSAGTYSGASEIERVGGGWLVFDS